MSLNATDQEAIDKDALIASLVEETRKLQSTVSDLQTKIQHGEAFDTTFEASRYSRGEAASFREIPETGMPAKHVVSLLWLHFNITARPCSTILT